MGTLEEWSKMIRNALIWLGEPDPCASKEKLREEDPQLQELSTVLHQWHTRFTDRPMTIAKVVEIANKPRQNNYNELQNPELHEALVVVAGISSKNDTKRLGKYLSFNKGRIIGEYQLILHHAVSEGSRQWIVLRKEAPPPVVSNPFYD